MGRKTGLEAKRRIEETNQELLVTFTENEKQVLRDLIKYYGKAV